MKDIFTIFNYENGIFKLKSNNVNFSSNTNPIKPKRQKEDQLYKSIIKGNLINIDPDPDKINFNMPVKITYGDALGRKDKEGNSYLSYFFDPA